MVSESDLPTFEAMLGGSRPGDGIGPLRHQVVSPISYAGRVRTPLLILHGRNDERVPVGQATGFFRELRRRGVPAQLVVYPREPHGVQEEAHQAECSAACGSGSRAGCGCEGGGSPLPQEVRSDPPGRPYALGRGRARAQPMGP